MSRFPNRKNTNYQWSNPTMSSQQFSSNYPDNSLNGSNCLGGSNYNPILYQQSNIYPPYPLNGCNPEFNGSFYHNQVNAMSNIVPDSKSKYLSTIIYPNNGKGKSTANLQRNSYISSSNKKSKFFQMNINKNKSAQFHCDLCKVPCSDQKALDDHIKGKNHRRREALVNQNNDDAIKQGSAYKCEVCEVLCSSKDALISHVKGKAHEKQITNLKRLKLPIPQVNYNPVSSTKEPLSDPGTIEEKPEDPPEESGGRQIVGEEYIEIINCNITGKFIEYSCKLCECRFSDVNAKNIHLSGKRHHSSFRQKVNPSFNSEIIKKNDKKSSGKKIKMKNAKRNKHDTKQHSAFLLNDALNHDTSYAMSFSLPVFYSLTMEDEKMYERCEQLSLSHDESIKIDKVYNLLEESLKNLFSTESKSFPENFLKIKCIEKVGILPCGIAINIDKEFDLNLVLNDYPTCEIFNYIVNNLLLDLEKTSQSKWRVEPKISEACILISKLDTDFSIKLCITSPMCRDSNIPQSRALELLSYDSTNNILRKVRHFNWFEHYYGTNKDVKSTVKILRQIAYKIPSWKIFNDDVYLMLLLFHTSISSIKEKLYPSGLLRRFLEMLASGLLIPQSFVIIDPCERNETNILKGLSQKIREDVTNCAQHALRMMSFDKLSDIIFINEKSEVDNNSPVSSPTEVLYEKDTNYLTSSIIKEEDDILNDNILEDNVCDSINVSRKRRTSDDLVYPEAKNLKTEP